MPGRHLLLVSLTIAAIGAVIYRINAITITLLLICVLLLMINFNRYLFVLLLSLTVPFTLYFIYDSHDLKQQISQVHPDKQQINGMIFPDSVNIDGDKLKTDAHLENGQVVRLYYTLTSETEKNNWLCETHVIRFSASAKVSRIKPATNFNQFDAQKYYETKHITHQANVEFLHCDSGQAKNWYQKIRYQLHIWHAMSLQNAEKLPQPLSDYAQALILGTTPQTLYENNPGVQVLGLIHLFSVSGFHVSYLLMLLMAGFKRLYIPKEIASGIGALALIMYFIFAGEPAVLVRALIAGLLLMFQQASHCKIKSFNIWALSLLGSLIYAPGILLTLGGQLSFALTFCLLFTQKLNFWQVNLLLSVVSFPLIVVQQYHWHLLQTCANFAAIPVFGTLIVPCVMIGYFGQSVTGVVYWMNATIASFAKTLDWLATWPGDLIIGKIPWLFVLLLLIAGLLCFVREKKVALYARVLWPTIFAITLIWTHFPVHGELTTFDIGQGDAALIRTPFNRTVTLIDTGGKVTFGQQKNWQKQRFTQTNGEAVIVNYLHSCGISRVDHLVLTHQDFDHIGDAKIILQKMSVKYVIVPAGMMKKEAYMREIQPYLKKAQVIEAIAGTKAPKLPLQILHPFVAGEADNENSIALFGKIGGKQLFTAGDLDQDGEVAIANRYPNLVVDLIKFGHHGSKTSTNPEIMKRWHPQIGIISAGRHNRYNHPSEETLKTAQDNQILVYNTQAHGMIKYSYFREKGHFKVKLTDEFTTTTAEH